ncbi:alpha/beta fold hydrolase [Streptomyces sp. NPDC058382]|uniref:alpha/beta fold hydrolase n=1 Tax=unclassified Streptomyces TaxID=2593676 RepID=UPI003635A21C
MRETLPRIAVPTLVVAAEGGRFVAPEHSAEIADGTSGAVLVGAMGGHSAVLQDPEPTREAPAGFLKGLHL